MLTTPSMALTQTVNPDSTFQAVPPSAQIVSPDTAWVIDRSGLEYVTEQLNRARLVEPQQAKIDSLESLVSTLKSRMALRDGLLESQDSVLTQYTKTLKASEELHPGPLEELYKMAPWLIAIFSAGIAVGG